MKNTFQFIKHLTSALYKQFKKDRKWILLPVIIILLLTSVLIIVLNISSPVLPFIYPLF